jgi:hypothetical protein
MLLIFVQKDYSSNREKRQKGTDGNRECDNTSHTQPEL